MDRNALLWTLVLFFGASLMFATIRDATEDQSVGLSLGLQLLAGALLVGGLVLFVRRRKK
ncbi:MAG TPA: hypothetical protein VEQ61_05725 [Thermoleophilaceae bacterium]|nr:hypothetical protein [Thermoleophilaceae bacterium]